jgi:hypothetical protein
MGLGFCGRIASHRVRRVIVATVYYMKGSFIYVCIFALADGTDLAHNIVVLFTALTEVVDAFSLRKMVFGV